VGVGGTLLVQGPDALSIVGTLTFSTIANYVICPAPLFILMGELLIFSEISKAAFDVAYKWLGRLPGGLAVAGNEACALFASIIGSSPATAATVGLVAVPEMLKRGYDKGLATGSIAAGGALGILIPPSILMVIYAVIAEESVGQLFMAGLIPGIMLDIMMSVYIVGRCIKNPKLGPRVRDVSWADTFKSTWRILPVISLTLLVLGSIYFGICTPTEAGGVGAFGAFCLALFSRKLTFPQFRAGLLGAVATSSFIMFIFLGAHYFGYLLTSLGIPQGLSETIASWHVSRWWIMIAFNVLYLLLGCIIDPAGIVLITGPVVIPIAQSLGFDMVWFGIIIVLNMEMANVTPPFGFNLYVIKGIVPDDVTVGDIIKGSAPFVLIQALAVVIVMVFPQLALWLPSKMITFKG
jgi:C4-dicarboxylate transporter DctM subunit